MVSLTHKSERVELTSDDIEITALPKSPKSAVKTPFERICETRVVSTTWLDEPDMEDIKIPPSQSTSEIEDNQRDTRSQEVCDSELNDESTFVPNLSTIQEETSPIQTGRKSIEALVPGINFEQILSHTR
ncbi:hypothetical protein CHS0354_021319 [Potamilus streckersoni]|uniref:Uncharacterized protein n=1 Tax=Potamilus streckersoni TaxID=2493646 RepID=A0AAE0TKZ9_9BIVA|nr:hypothetical protein CHS0354_021319 [Potamilus streckersoni]